MWDAGYMWWIGMIKSLVILALLVGGAILITRMIVNRPSAGGSSPLRAGPSLEAVRILEERFARGEIDESEFRSRRDALRT